MIVLLRVFLAACLFRSATDKVSTLRGHAFGRAHGHCHIGQCRRALVNDCIFSTRSQSLYQCRQSTAQPAVSASALHWGNGPVDSNRSDAYQRRFEPIGNCRVGRFFHLNRIGHRRASSRPRVAIVATWPKLTQRSIVHRSALGNITDFDSMPVVAGLAVLPPATRASFFAGTAEHRQAIALGRYSCVSRILPEHRTNVKK